LLINLKKAISREDAKTRRKIRNLPDKTIHLAGDISLFRFCWHPFASSPVTAERRGGMIIKGIFIGAVVLIFCSGALAGEAKCNANPSDYKKIISVLKKTDYILVDQVFCPKIVGNYAVARFSNNIDGGEAYLVKSGGNWQVVTAGTAIGPEELSSMGFPEDVVKKLAE